MMSTTPWAVALVHLSLLVFLTEANEHDRSSFLRSNNGGAETNIESTSGHSSTNIGVEPGPPVVDLLAPPMGFMSWERFHCQTDCKKYPGECINEQLYMEMADALVSGGYAAAGYKRVHIDDCWSAGRDAVTGELLADPDRFPSGIPALVEYVQKQGLQLGIYSDVGPYTCAHYAGSLGYEDLDAATFAKWGVDYVKLDGCHMDLKDYQASYVAFGNALKKVASTKKMIYSCSWPAYITSESGDESQVPFDVMFNQAGCNTWRNWHDMSNSWDKVKSIILHWADNWEALHDIPTGSFNDADMLIAGDDGGKDATMLSVDIAKLQFGFWALISSPMLIGGDVRSMPPEYRKVLLNGYVISVSQDRLRSQATCVVGCKTTGKSPRSSSSANRSSSEEIQVWTKHLDGYSIQNTAIGFFNLGNSTTAYSIDYNFPLDSKPSMIFCSDLWSDNPTMNVCSMLSTTSSVQQERDEADDDSIWDFDIVTEDDGSVYLRIAALKVPPQSHRLVRVYLRYTDSSLVVTEQRQDEWQTFQQEVSRLALV